jgi:hypothetical protein
MGAEFYKWHRLVYTRRFTPAGAQSLKDARYVGGVYGGSLRTVEVQFFATRLNNMGGNILNPVSDIAQTCSC